MKLSKIYNKNKNLINILLLLTVVVLAVVLGCKLAKENFKSAGEIDRMREIKKADAYLRTKARLREEIMGQPEQDSMGPSKNNTANKNNYNDMEDWRKMRADLDREVADGVMSPEKADEILKELRRSEMNSGN